MRSWSSFPLFVLLCAFLLPPPAHAIKRRKDDTFDFGSTNCFAGMIQGKVYDIPYDTQRLGPMLPTLERTKPGGTVCTFTLNVPTRSWLQGITGVTDRLEWFAIDYQADFWVKEAGRYSFSLESDDGSILFIDERRVVDNDGVHSTTYASGRTELTEGMHHLRVAYYQGPRDEVALTLKVSPPKGDWKLFDIRDYRLPMPAPVETAEDDQQRPILRRADSAHDPLSEKLFERPAMEALQASPPPHAFDFHVSALRFRPGVVGSQYAVAVDVPAAGIKTTPGPLQTFRLHVLVIALIRDAGGRVVEKISHDFPFTFPDTRLAALRAGSLRYSQPVTLPPGRYTLEAAVADREANQASVETVQFENPGSGGVALSDLLLVKTLDDVNGPPDPADPLEYGGKRASPELDGVVNMSAHPFVYFMVYPDTAAEAKPSMEVELSLAGRVIARQTADLPAPDPSGAIPMSIATVPAPGKYAIKIAIQQGAQRVERRLEYAVAGQ
ncbi:MAG: PA14 domain-containing protein [Bryobacteraceae bacterium]